MLLTVYKGEFRYVVHQQRAGDDSTTQLRKALATLLQLHLNMCLKYCFIMKCSPIGSIQQKHCMATETYCYVSVTKPASHHKGRISELAGYESALSSSSSCETCSGTVCAFIICTYIKFSIAQLRYATYSCFLFGFQCLQHHTFQMIPFPLSVQIYI